MKRTIETIGKVWKDPVWSKVIASIIIGAGVYVGAILFEIGRLIYAGTDFGSIWKLLRETFLKSVAIPIWVILLFISALGPIFLYVWRGFSLRFKQQKLLQLQNENESEQKYLNSFDENAPIFPYDTARYFLAGRLASAFPGITSDISWYKGKNAAKRLEIVLRTPLSFRLTTRTYIDPIWWFRCGRSDSIRRFEIISGKRCLMNREEIVINKIAVQRHQLEYKSFIYVEVSSDSSSGVYPYDRSHIQEMVKRYGYAWETFGILGKFHIRSAEHDDGAAEINGKVVDASTSRLRTRYLSNYNFVITAKDAPFNSRKFDKDSRRYLNGLLDGSVSFNEFYIFMDSFESGDS